MKKLMLIASCVALVGGVYSQTPVPVEDQNTEAAIEQDRDVNTIMQEYLEKKRME